MKVNFSAVKVMALLLKLMQGRPLHLIFFFFKDPEGGTQVQVGKYIRPRQCLLFVLVSPVISDVSQVLEVM